MHSRFSVLGMNSMNALLVLGCSFVQSIYHGLDPSFYFAFVSKDSSLQLFFKLTQEVDDADLLIAAIGMDESDLRLIIEDVQGEPCGLEGVGQGLQGPNGSGDGDVQQQQRGDGKGRERLKKLYKITEDELAINSLENCVVMRMAVKDH